MTPERMLSRLSDRELEVLGAVADGLSNQGVGQRLGVSVKTVEAACRSIFQKLELADSSHLNRRVQAARLYLEHGPLAPTPAAAAPLLGRRDELRHVDDLLHAHQIVTVVGPGGGGKTALARAVGARRADTGCSFRFVDLVPARDRNGIAAALGDAFGVVAASSDAMFRRVRARIGDDATVIVFDNAEHVAAEMVHALGRFDPPANVRVLVTSRVALGARGEHAWTIPPMNQDDSASLLRARAAVELPPDTVDEVCAAADGVPLAIELLGARLSSLGIDHVVARLSRLPSLLRTVTGGRHASITAALVDSYDSLQPNEQRLFRALSVFPSGCTEADVELFARDRFGDARLAIDSLASVSLLTRTGERVHFLEPIRQQAAAQLDDAGEREPAERSLVDWAVAVARRTSSRAASRDDPGWRAAFAHDVHGVEHACELAIASGDASAAHRIATAVCDYRYTATPERGYQLAQRALDMTGPDGPSRTDLLLSVGRLAVQLRPPDIAHVLGEAFARYEADGDVVGAARSLELIAADTREVADGERAVEAADRSGEAVVRGWSRVFHAVALWRHDAPEHDVLAMLDEAAAIATEGASQHALAGAELTRGAFLLRTGRPAAEVLASLDAAQSTFTALGDLYELADCAHQRAALHIRDADPNHAAPATAQLLELCLTAIDDPVTLCDAVLDAAAVFALSDRPLLAAEVACVAFAYNDTIQPLWRRPVHERLRPLIEQRAAVEADPAALSNVATRALTELRRAVSDQPRHMSRPEQPS